MSIKKHITNLVKNPNLYVAAVVGTVPGGAVGGVVGAVSGGFIGIRLELCPGWAVPLVGVNFGSVAGALFGLIMGAILGGILTGCFSLYKIHKKHISCLNYPRSR
ncbi:hypothetical protein Loa_01374 [Legionella oakridgensis ATCC 33761 = DSM 21215]|uniref:Uncharacterized protein n=1 Tax=Legionella oakridgensis ATCC 33761 = DSM 21215 TaxID=1268635 RepID=W0BE77_9GAMM|nr:hypothetical protein [Legionella oakridgensis]AHE66927.1 hypothetical protein Loa_01374 [Legionella oakridgensis ATCC 33761 = DSM 21215]